MFLTAITLQIWNTGGIGLQICHEVTGVLDTSYELRGGIWLHTNHREVCRYWKSLFRSFLSFEYRRIEECLWMKN